ncbi:ubiquitin-protein ligase Anaphase Promoting Complex [Orbilia oligospora]|uniref:Anaphase-promoting complex subunit 11 n=1 Tax=Orbilia oligospora TaxID=2813651 RepID=A0A7C8K7H9_ORBOL|nr:ubiquitin-protein ligase Anaphase Promoting Complex [Orbilia oligospora]KAF3186215.1 ubiquitin-protein ligase Anaphase Promoting Complex [Orbilia oligospora]TGJ73559.1 ubiquitin-protein ligase Anaphase Promoting Complex [Orbilia oligospora]
MKVKIKEWHAVATWRWDMPEDEVCGICRVDFDGCCPNCKYPGDDCPLIVGKCHHSFHLHCILSWINQESAKGLCPMCRQKFEDPSVRGEINVGELPEEFRARLDELNRRIVQMLEQTELTRLERMRALIARAAAREGGE